MNLFFLPFPFSLAPPFILVHFPSSHSPPLTHIHSLHCSLEKTLMKYYDKRFYFQRLATYSRCLARFSPIFCRRASLIFSTSMKPFGPTIVSSLSELR